MNIQICYNFQFTNVNDMIYWIIHPLYNPRKIENR